MRYDQVVLFQSTGVATFLSRPLVKCSKSISCGRIRKAHGNWLNNSPANGYRSLEKKRRAPSLSCAQEMSRTFGSGRGTQVLPRSSCMGAAERGDRCGARVMVPTKAMVAARK